MLRQRVFVGAVILSVVAWGTPARSADPPEIPLTIENHRFTPEAITVTAGTSFVLVITNKDATPEEVESHELRIEKMNPAGQAPPPPKPAPQKGTDNLLGRFHQKTPQGTDNAGES